jgi:3-(3-hydroxy-phenyl)propionate hydroxylase
LQKALGRFGSVSVLYGWRLVHHEQSAEGVTMRLLGPSDEVRHVACDYLVGCDGAASTVREQLGITLEGATFEERWLVVDLENHDNQARHTDVFCDPRRPGIALPGPSRTRRYEFKLLQGESDEDLLDEQTVVRLLREHGADPRATIRRKVVYRFHARVARRWSVGRVFIAGDAAHLTPPFAGQGMNSGIRDAFNLAWKMAAVVQGVAGSRLLDTYECERRGHAWKMIRLALRMGFVMSPPNAASGTLLRAAFRALDVWPRARDYVLQMKYKPVPHLRSGFVIPDGKSARRTLVGKLFPQPVVQTPAGRTLLFDDCLGSQFALVAYTRDADAAYARLKHPVWDRIGVVQIAILPRHNSAGADPGIACVFDPDGSLSTMFSGYENQILLLRPDRFVVASIDAGKPDAGLRRLEKLLAETWEL